MQGFAWVGLLCLLTVVLSACDDKPASTTVTQPTSTPTPLVTLTPTSESVPTRTPTHTPVPIAASTPTNTPTPPPTSTAEGNAATRVHTSVGICDRTEQVRDAILERIDGVDDCAAVTAAQLATIDGKIHPAGGENAANFQPGDFDGLTALETLDLRGAGFTYLEAGVFDGLASLTVLNLGGIYYIAYPDWLGSPYKNRLASLEKGGVCGTYIVESALPWRWPQIDLPGGRYIRRSQRA